MPCRNNRLVEMALEDRLFQDFEGRLGVSGFLPRYLDWIRELTPEEASLIDHLRDVSRDVVSISGLGFRMHHLAEAYDLRCWYTDHGVKLKDFAKVDPRTLGISMSELRRFCEFGFGTELDLYSRVAERSLGVQIPHPAFSLVHPVTEMRAVDEQDAQAVMMGYHAAALRSRRAFFPDQKTTITYEDLSAAMRFFQQGGDRYQNPDATLIRALDYLAKSSEAVRCPESAVYTGR